MSSLKAEIQSQREEFERKKSLGEQQVNEIRANLRQSQCERECEHSDHAAMIKELQQKIAQERLQNEHMHKEVTDSPKSHV